MTLDNITLWNGKSVPRIGIGTWVIGGEQYANGKPTGWANVDDATSIQTLHKAFELGVRIIDTSGSYGAGRSESIIARAIKESDLNREDVVICTKAGIVCDPSSGNIIGTTDKKNDISTTIDASLERLQTDYIDLVKFHINRHPIENSHGAFEAFSDAYSAGKIGAFGWSNDDLDGGLAFASLDGYVAIQHDLNIFSPANDLLQGIEKHALWSFNRQPLAMGLLSGKYHGKRPKVGDNDIRSSGFAWLRYFDRKGAPTIELVEAVEQIRALLTADGRTVAQGALGWCLAQSDKAIPLPGCRTPAQATDNFGVLKLNPMDSKVVDEINNVLSDLQRPIV